VQSLEQMALVLLFESFAIYKIVALVQKAFLFVMRSAAT
jgi:hypothetical protein